MAHGVNRESLSLCIADDHYCAINWYGRLLIITNETEPVQKVKVIFLTARDAAV